MPSQRLPANTSIGPEGQVNLTSAGDSANSTAVLVANSDCLAPVALCSAKPVSAVTNLLPAQRRVSDVLKHPMSGSIKTKTDQPVVTLPFVRTHGYQRQDLTGNAIDACPALVDPISAVSHLVTPPVVLSNCAEPTPAPVVTALALPALNSVIGAVLAGGPGTQRSLLLNVVLERSGDDVHLVLGRQALRTPSSLLLKVDELAAPQASGSMASHNLRLSLLGQGAKAATSFTLTVSSGQLAALADQLKSGTGRLVINGKNLPALAGNNYPSLCASQQAVADTGTVGVKQSPGSKVQTPDGVATHVSELPFNNVPPELLSTSLAMPATEAGLQNVHSLSLKGIRSIRVEGRHLRNMPTLPPLPAPKDFDCNSPDSTPPDSPTSSTSPSSLGYEPSFAASDSDTSNTAELIPSGVAVPASASSGRDFLSLRSSQVVAEPARSFPEGGSYPGFKRFASASDIPSLIWQPVSAPSLLITPSLPDIGDSIDGPMSIGSMRVVYSLDPSKSGDESEASWEIVEHFGQRLKRENRDLELHEHLVHQQAYNLEGKDRVILLGKQQCLVEKVTGVPAGLNAYILIPEITPAEGPIEVQLIFRGTKDRASVVRDLESSGPGFETMEDSAASIIRRLQIVLASLNDSSRKINLTIGGHSLGGADAQNFLGHLLGAMASAEAGAGSHLTAIDHITLFTKCSAGVPRLAHERVCSALERLKGHGAVRLKIFHLKVAGDVVQATGDCHIGACLSYEAVDVSVLQVYPPPLANIYDRHTKKYFTDDTNLSPVYWYKLTQNNSEEGIAEISRSLHNTSTVLRYKVVRNMQWAFHCAVWYLVPSGNSQAKLKPKPPALAVESADSSLEFSSEQEIKVAYDQIISYCLGLSNRSRNTPWNKINPYIAHNSAANFKPHYLEKMLDEAAFSAVAEFQNLVNQVNTHALNISDPKMMRGLRIKVGLGGNLSNDPDVSFKGQAIKDALWPTTTHYCENFFAAAARQHATASPGRGQQKNSTCYTFELLLRLQAFNARYTKLERDLYKINYSGEVDGALRSEKLAVLKQRAATLQHEVGELYRQCRLNRLSAEKTSFILGSPVSCLNGSELISRKVVRIKKSIDKELERVTGS